MPGGNALIVLVGADGEAAGGVTDGLFESGVMFPAVRFTGGLDAGIALSGTPVNPTSFTGIPERSAPDEGRLAGRVVEGKVVAGVAEPRPVLAAGFEFDVRAEEESIGDVGTGAGLAGRGMAGFAPGTVVAGVGVLTVVRLVGVVTGAPGLPGTLVLLVTGLGVIGGRLLFVVGGLG